MSLETRIVQYTFALIDLGVDENILKMSSYFEILIITYAVIQRMRVLHEENNHMHEEIIKYVNEIKSLSTQLIDKENN